ncbi:MAG: DNA-binding response regulator, partial [Oscillospiraceae bacterium]|nr:DNA-binding response regulator [Oscillospiraceae bacterium]
HAPVRRPREKLYANPAQPTYVMTKRGVGYYFGG